MSCLPWGPAMRAAARIGLTPADFWALSLKEWRLLTEQESIGVLTRAAFEALCVSHPDGSQKIGGDST